LCYDIVYICLLLVATALCMTVIEWHLCVIEHDGNNYNDGNSDDDDGSDIDGSDDDSDDIDDDDGDDDTYDDDDI